MMDVSCDSVSREKQTPQLSPSISDTMITTSVSTFMTKLLTKLWLPFCLRFFSIYVWSSVRVVTCVYALSMCVRDSVTACCLVSEVTNVSLQVDHLSRPVALLVNEVREPQSTPSSPLSHQHGQTRTHERSRRSHHLLLQPSFSLLTSTTNKREALHQQEVGEAAVAHSGQSLASIFSKFLERLCLFQSSVMTGKLAYPCNVKKWKSLGPKK